MYELGLEDPLRLAKRARILPLVERERLHRQWEDACYRRQLEQVESDLLFRAAGPHGNETSFMNDLRPERWTDVQLHFRSEKKHTVLMRMAISLSSSIPSIVVTPPELQNRNLSGST